MATRALHRAFLPDLPRRVALAVLLLCATPSMAQEAEAPPGDPPAAAEPAPPKARQRPKPTVRAKPPEKPTADAKPGPAQPAAAQPGAQPAIWPAGADTVSESYGEWTMSCARGEGRTACMVAQSQGDKATGRRQFALELRAPKDGRAEGLILMPFGLAIEPGVTFKLDEAALGKGAFYAYCTGDGCLVPISFPTLATDAMKTAKALVVTGQKASDNEPVTITLPLAGFAPAFARAMALGS